MDNSKKDNILAYRIERHHQSKLLDPTIIEHNIRESTKVHNPKYIMSAGSAWLRANPGSTLRDLEKKFSEMNIDTMIIAVIPKDNSDFDLSVPGNPKIKPKLIGSFVHGLRKQEYLREILTKEYRTTFSLNLANLKRAGYSCTKGQALDVATGKMPTDLEKLKHTDIMNQLQWASIKIVVERVDPEIILRGEIQRINQKYGYGPYYYRVKIDDMMIDVLVTPDEGQIRILSDFGIMHRNGTEAAIHIKNYLRNEYSKTYQTHLAEKITNEVISNALNKFDVNKIVNVSEEERKAIVNYLQNQLKLTGEFPDPATPASKKTMKFVPPLCKKVVIKKTSGDEK